VSIVSSRWSSNVDKSMVHPSLVRVVDRALERLDAAGAPFKIYFGVRSFDEQESLYAKGRTTPGDIVTWARGGDSMHNYGLAVDAAPYDMRTSNPGDVYWPDPSKTTGPWKSLEDAIARAARDVDGEDDGLNYETGLRWRRTDAPHCQVRTTIQELGAGLYPCCNDIDWLVMAHTTFLFELPWMARRVQFLLNRLGYKAGAVDGDVGPSTIVAMINFRKDNGMPREQEFITRGLVEQLVRRTFA